MGFHLRFRVQGRVKQGRCGKQPPDPGGMGRRNFIEDAVQVGRQFFGHLRADEALAGFFHGGGQRGGGMIRRSRHVAQDAVQHRLPGVAVEEGDGFTALDDARQRHGIRQPVQFQGKEVVEKGGAHIGMGRVGEGVAGVGVALHQGAVQGEIEAQRDASAGIGKEVAADAVRTMAGEVKRDFLAAKIRPFLHEQRIQHIMREAGCGADGVFRRRPRRDVARQHEKTVPAAVLATHRTRANAIGTSHLAAAAACLADVLHRAAAAVLPVTVFRHLLAMLPGTAAGGAGLATDTAATAADRPSLALTQRAVFLHGKRREAVKDGFLQRLRQPLPPCLAEAVDKRLAQRGACLRLVQHRCCFPLESLHILAAMPRGRFAAGNAPLLDIAAETPHDVQLDGERLGLMRHLLHLLRIHLVAMRQILELAQQGGGQILRVITLNQHAENL